MRVRRAPPWVPGPHESWTDAPPMVVLEMRISEFIGWCFIAGLLGYGIARGYLP